VTEKIPPVYRVLFLEDLEKSQFPGWTFAWDQPWECWWNQLLAKFIIKHWGNAQHAGSLKAFYIDPAKSSNSVLQLGVLHQWFVGRKDGVRLGYFSPTRKTAKKKSEKISKFQLQVGSHLLQLSSFMVSRASLNLSFLFSSKNIGKTSCPSSQSLEMRWNYLTSSSALQKQKKFRKRFSLGFL
jgi:hypothetical protein